MINKYSLHFKDQRDEDSFISLSKQRILRDFGTFALLTVAFSMLQMVAFINKGSYTIAFICLFISMMTAIFYKVIKARPQRLNFILVVYQIVTAVTFEVNYYISPDETVPITYNWFYGYQCSFFHLIIYLQGSQYIQQSIALFCIFTFHLANYINFDQEGSFNILIFYWICFSTMAFRYVIEYEKRMTFIYSREQLKWNNFIEKTLNSWMIMVKFDSKQNLLGLVRCNRSLKDQFNIRDDQGMRSFFRGIHLKKKKNELQRDTERSQKCLEEFITKLFIEEFQDGKLLRESAYTSILAILKSQNLALEIKILRCYQDNDIKLLLVLEGKHEIKRIKSLNSKQKILSALVRDIHNYLRPVLCYNLRNLINIDKGKNLIRNKLAGHFCLNTIQNIELVCQEKLNYFDESISVRRVMSYIKNLFGNSVEIHDVPDVSIDMNFNQMIQLNISIISLILDLSTKKQTRIIISAQEYENIIKVSLLFDCCSIRQSHLDILNSQRSISFKYKSLKQTYQGQIQTVLDNLYHLQKRLVEFDFNNPYLNMLKLACASYILAQYGPDSYFQVRTESYCNFVLVKYHLYKEKLEVLGLQERDQFLRKEPHTSIQRFEFDK